MDSLLLVANYDSAVGYAWWLMESFWAKLAEHYHNHNRVILAYPSISTLPPIIAQAPLQAIELDFSGTGRRQILAQCRFLHYHQVRIIYFSDHPTWHWSYLLYRLCGVHLIIVHDHTPGLRSPPRGLKRWLKRMIHRLPWVTVDGAIGATDFVRQRFISVNGMPSRRCFAAPNGLPPSRPHPTAELCSLFNIPAGRKILVMVSRANRYKGISFVLQCMTQIGTEARRNLHFLFIGAGPHLVDFIADARKRGLSGNCTFVGRHDDVPSLLEGADVAFHPSQGEVGYSLSILEYMRAGLPVLVPDNPSVCGATEHGINGLVYPEGNVDAACSMLLRLLNSKVLRDQLGREAREAVQRFSLAGTHAALLDAFEKIDRGEAYFSINRKKGVT